MCAMYYPGGHAIHPNEDVFARDLAKKLPEDFIVVPNATLDTGRNTFDLDTTVIGPLGVVVIELKTWRGTIEVQPGAYWNRLMGAERVTVRSPLETVLLKQRAFHSRLCDMDMMHVSVQGVVALFGDQTQLTGRRRDRRLVLPASKVADEILARKLIYYMPIVRATTASERFAIRDMLASRPASGAPFTHGYDVGLRVGSNEQEGWFEFAGTERLTGRAVAIRVWPAKLAGPYGSADLREAHALSLIYCPQVIRSFCTLPDYDHDDTLITVTEALPPTSLDDFLPPAERPSRELGRQWLRLAFVGLDACHDHGIIHRNLSPRRVRIVDGRGPVITDFDRARVPGIPTIGSMACQQSPYVAPELAFSLAPASPRSDLYSMAAIFAALVGVPTECSGEARRSILRQEFGERTGDVVHDYLANEPLSRPESAKALLATY